MDVGLVLPMALIGLSNGMDFGYKRALIMENLPITKPAIPWGNQAMLALALVLTVILFLESPEVSEILILGSMWLGFLVAYGVSAALAFLITRYFVRKRRPV
jgi:hypothetical protein